MAFPFLWFLFCLPAVVVAISKKRNPLVWLIAGILFGPIGFFTIGFMPPKEDERSRRKCPFCAEHVPAEAKLLVVPFGFCQRVIGGLLDLLVFFDRHANNTVPGHIRHDNLSGIVAVRPELRLASHGRGKGRLLHKRSPQEFCSS